MYGKWSMYHCSGIPARRLFNGSKFHGSRISECDVRNTHFSMSAFYSGDFRLPCLAWLTSFPGLAPPPPSSSCLQPAQQTCTVLASGSSWGSGCGWEWKDKYLQENLSTFILGIYLTNRHVNLQIESFIIHSQLWLWDSTYLVVSRTEPIYGKIRTLLNSKLVCPYLFFLALAFFLAMGPFVL